VRGESSGFALKSGVIAIDDRGGFDARDYRLSVAAVCGQNRMAVWGVKIAAAQRMPKN
jgi:hypothetical protein